MKKRDTTNCKAATLDVPALRVKECRIEDLEMRACGRESMRRPVAAVCTSMVKASSMPEIVATMRKRKRFG